MVIAVVLAVLVATPALADVLCKKKNGAVVARVACKGKEVQLDLAQFGAIGPKGDPGPKGDVGAQGTPGEQGPAGPLLVTLPSGATQRGFFGGGAAGTSDTVVESPLSFPVPLASDVTAHVIPVGGPPTTECAGSVSAPSAAPGHLCLYLGWIDGTCSDTVDTFGFAGLADRQFGVVVTVPMESSGQCDFSGTWAVTAP